MKMAHIPKKELQILKIRPYPAKGGVLYKANYSSQQCDD